MIPERRRSHSKPPELSRWMFGGRWIFGFVPIATSHSQKSPGRGKHGYCVSFYSSWSARQASP